MSSWWTHSLSTNVKYAFSSIFYKHLILEATVQESSLFCLSVFFIKFFFPFQRLFCLECFLVTPTHAFFSSQNLSLKKLRVSSEKECAIHYLLQNNPFWLRCCGSRVFLVNTQLGFIHLFTLFFLFFPCVRSFHHTFSSCFLFPSFILFFYHFIFYFIIL